jgi:hypothetical protein
VQPHLSVKARVEIDQQALGPSAHELGLEDAVIAAGPTQSHQSLEDHMVDRCFLEAQSHADAVRPLQSTRRQAA